MITRAIFKNLKGLSSIDIRLGRLTVLVGPNAVGKTTILEGLEMVSCLTHWGVNQPSEVWEWFDGYWDFKKLLMHGSEGMEVRVFLSEQEQSSFLFRSDKNQSMHLSTPEKNQKSELADLFKVRSVTFALETLKTASVISGVQPGEWSGGDGLAAYLQYLHGLRDGTLERIEEQVRRVVPRFRQLRFEPTAVEREETEILTVNNEALNRRVKRHYPGVELRFEFSDGSLVPAEHVSEGTLLTLALCSVIFSPRSGGTLLIDDLDRALHPAAQARVIAAIRGALDATPGLQIVATTHSPDLVDACSPDEVRVMGFDDKGIPRLADLSQHPEAARWAKLMRTGEFWGSVGEDWVAQIPAPKEPPAQESPEEAPGEGERG